MRRLKFLFSLLLLFSIACEASPGVEGAADGDSAEAVGVEFPQTNRPDVRGIEGAVSSDHPLASAAGMEILRRGGNATDAAIAMAGVLAVVRPHMNGIGGDAFAIFYDGETGEVTSLNGSGRSGQRATPDFFDGLDEVPQSGAGSVSVPGTVAAWEDALARHGTMSLADVLGPAIRYADEGFPVSSRLQSDIRGAQRVLDDPARAIFVPGGGPPEVGSRLRNPALAETLRRIASDGAAAFYTGRVAEALVSYVEAGGGHLTVEDFATHESTWVNPLSSAYLGFDFYVMPPNTQGIAQLQQFEMAKSIDFTGMAHNSEPYLHTLIELKKLAFADRDRWVSDPEFSDLPIDELLDPTYLQARAAQVGDDAADEVQPGVGDPLAPPTDADDSGDTVYLTVVDSDGNAVSWIQSLFASFGSGLLEPETGIVLQNRGALFSLDPNHPNIVAPGKRPYHTLTPMMALRDGRFAFTIGTPGGDSQTQSLLQIVHNLVLFEMTPQEAIEAPRYRSYDGLAVSIEDRITPEVRAGLESRGHELRVVHGWTSTFGGAQMIGWDARSGTLVVASDPRREAYGIAY